MVCELDMDVDSFVLECAKAIEVELHRHGISNVVRNSEDIIITRCCDDCAPFSVYTIYCAPASTGVHVYSRDRCYRFEYSNPDMIVEIVRSICAMASCD
jgi:hypothetical protein